jgi:hypothetical protein
MTANRLLLGAIGLAALGLVVLLAGQSLELGIGLLGAGTGAGLAAHRLGKEKR